MKLLLTYLMALGLLSVAAVACGIDVTDSKMVAGLMLLSFLSAVVALFVAAFVLALIAVLKMPRIPGDWLVRVNKARVIRIAEHIPWWRRVALHLIGWRVSKA